MSDSDDAADVVALMRWTVAAWDALVRHERAARRGSEATGHPSAALREATARREVFERAMMQALTSKSSAARDGLQRLRSRYAPSKDPSKTLAALRDGAVPMEFTATVVRGVPIGRDRQTLVAIASLMLAELLAGIYDEAELPDTEEMNDHLTVVADAITAATADGEEVPVGKLRTFITRALKSRTMENRDVDAENGSSGARYDARRIVGALTGLSDDTIERAIEETGPYGWEQIER